MGRRLPLPVDAQNAVNALDGDADAEGCLGQVRQVAAGLDRQGFIGQPQWGGREGGRALQMGARPPPPTDSEPGEWGSQFCNTTQLPLPSSVSGSPCSVCIIVSITLDSSSLSLRQRLFTCASWVSHQTRVQDRTEHIPRADLGKVPGAVARHRSQVRMWSCHWILEAATERLRTRALAPERTLARVSREAGATVRCNAKLVDMNVAVPVTKEPWKSFGIRPSTISLSSVGRGTLLCGVS